MSNTEKILQLCECNERFAHAILKNTAEIRAAHASGSTGKRNRKRPSGLKAEARIYRTKQLARSK